MPEQYLELFQISDTPSFRWLDDLYNICDQVGMPLIYFGLDPKEMYELECGHDDCFILFLEVLDPHLWTNFNPFLSSN